METVVQQPPDAAEELPLLTSWGEGDYVRRREAGLISIVVHIVGIAGLMLLPSEFFSAPVREPLEVARQVTPLVAPRDLTQPDPNRGPISKEITSSAAIPRPQINIPPSPPSTTRPAARIPAPAPMRASPGVPLPEPPKMEASTRGPDAPRLGPAEAPAPPPPPKLEPQERPKLAFETPGSPSGAPSGLGRSPTAGSAVSEAVRNVARGGGSTGLVVGDAGLGIGGIGEMLSMPPSPGKQASALELLSDPQGVDFRPYLIQILQNVRRNWFAVMPESAKLGRRGRVLIQFAIARDGRVPKLVIVSHSGTDALDRAAVAGISASNPFPPLPPEFGGDQVRLQFTFVYNMPSR